MTRLIRQPSVLAPATAQRIEREWEAEVERYGDATHWMPCGYCHGRVIHQNLAADTTYAVYDDVTDSYWHRDCWEWDQANG